MERQRDSLDRVGLAARWGVSVRKIDAETRAGRIPHLRIGRRVIYPLAVLERFEAEQAMAALRPVAAPPAASGPRRRRVAQPGQSA